MKIPHWSRHFILITFRFITVGTLSGIIAFPLIGLFIKTENSSLQLAWIGAQTLGLCSCLIGPILALILTARKITSGAENDATEISKSENQADR